MSKEKILEVFYDFSDYINGKKDIPKKFLKTDPLRKYAEGDPISNIIYDMYKRYKNGPQDIDPNNLSSKNNIKPIVQTETSILSHN